MKFKPDKKYLALGLTLLIVSCLSIVFCYFMFHNDIVLKFGSKIIGICSPIFDGIIIAFLINPIIIFFERSFFPIFKSGKKSAHNNVQSTDENTSETKSVDYGNKKSFSFVFKRVLSVILSFTIVLGLIFLFFYAVIPQIVDSATNIYNQSDNYRNTILKFFISIKDKNPNLYAFIINLVDEYSYQLENWRDSFLIPKITEIIKNLSSGLFSFAGALWNLILGTIISIYVLINKEKFKGQYKKLSFGILGIEYGNKFLSNMRFVLDKFSGFIVGKLVDSLIIGIICYIGCLIFKFDYPVLIALVVGVTNIIPFFGPFIGGGICALLLILTNPLKCLYFVIFVIVLQQFDGNVLGPKLLGDSTGLSGFWVIFAITLFGGLWGVPGMVIGVPLFAVIYSAIKIGIESSLSKKGIPTDSYEYTDIDYINLEDNKIVYVDYKERDRKKSGEGSKLNMNIKDLIKKKNKTKKNK